MGGVVSLVSKGHPWPGLWLQVCEVVTWDQGGEQGGFTSRHVPLTPFSQL